MNTKVSGHLNDDQFMECVMGAEPGVAAAAHLQECEICREELARFGGAVSSFNRASQAWSEARPVEVRPVGSGYWVARPFFAVASYALAACLVLTVGVEVMVHHGLGGGPATVASGGETAEDSAAQIAQDNKLLMDVDSAIRSDDRSLVQQYRLGPAMDGRAKTRGVAKN
jgi:predicted anti-sigma-YlaC factor YlaD